ncbi:hypothetical protein [Pseudanabaena sp. UWO311]|uniref:hypothetical protein n=1 Tax=Pseudanabaena sp. UWO311 TaxID=2487337 RepID=UPI0016810E8D|nr:hypothetical protein [Pseudanabaena sp. UWO311]
MQFAVTLVFKSKSIRRRVASNAFELLWIVEITFMIAYSIKSNFSDRLNTLNGKAIAL